MSSKQLALAAYRALLRSCKDLAATEGREGVGRVILRQPIDKDGWKQGKFRTYPPGTDLQQEAMKSLFPSLAQAPVSSPLTLSTLQDCVRSNFRAGGNAKGEEASKLLDQALEALRILAEQNYMAECSSSFSSDNVLVEATSSFLGRMPEDLLGQDQARWLWTYRCRVQNKGNKPSCSQEPLILWGRHWIILDGSSRVVAEVPYGSQGVIGQQPLLEPGSTFEYYSGTELESPSGSMQGAFQCVTLNACGLLEQPVEARIRPFKLLSSKKPPP